MIVFLNLFQNLNQKKTFPQTVSQVKNYPNIKARKLSNRVRETHTIIPHRDEKDSQQYVSKYYTQKVYVVSNNQPIQINITAKHIGISNDETAPDEAHI